MSFGDYQTAGLVLASSSPQRSAILERIGIPFTVVKPDADETVPKTVSPEMLPAYLARKKALSVAGNVSGGFVLGADTVVLFGGRVYGKPENAEMARAFLKALSGHRHKVITALALYDKARGTLHETAATTRVTIAPLSDAVIGWYIGTGEWRGAAGGYRVQGQGARLIRSLTGLESTVIGLPVYPLMTLLAKTEQPQWIMEPVPKLG
ncbi:MAG: Maf family protein [Spirochaetaceae bacterium]|jgi:septum formation protein|nr:Maf family protein [Spirochaetaceae bacterium]